MPQRLDERPPHRVLGPRRRLLARGERAQRRVDRAALLAGVAEEHGGPQLPRLAEQAGERAAQLLGAERLVLEERELPAVERLGERRVRVGERRARSSTSRVTSARNESSRVGSPGGCVAAIGSTGRIPNGRQSSRSKSTGPAATGAAVASRIAETASASSAGASGGSSPGSSSRSSSITQ